MSDLQIHYQDSTCAVGSWKNVFISVHGAAATADQLRALRRALNPHYARWAGNTCSISLAEAAATVATATPESREETARLNRDFPVSLGSALIVEGAGFRGAAIRTMLSGIYLVTRQSYPRKIFDTLAQAAEWLAPIAGKNQPNPYHPRELIAAVAAMRASLIRQ